jgi:hypothetical protein
MAHETTFLGVTGLALCGVSLHDRLMSVYELVALMGIRRRDRSHVRQRSRVSIERANGRLLRRVDVALYTKLLRMTRRTARRDGVDLRTAGRCKRERSMSFAFCEP